MIFPFTLGSTTKFLPVSCDTSLITLKISASCKFHKRPDGEGVELGKPIELEVGIHAGIAVGIAVGATTGLLRSACSAKLTMLTNRTTTKSPRIRFIYSQSH